MARQKKVEKYVPQTKLPASGNEWRILERAGFSGTQMIDLMREREKEFQQNGGTYWGTYVAMWDRGEITEQNFNQVIPTWRRRRMCSSIWPRTEEFKKLNDQFMAEFDSREDLQHIYHECTKGRRWVYNLNDESVDLTISSNHHFITRPESYMMYLSVINRSGRAMIEQARETPYQEGDLVVLRDTEIDNDCDPLRITRWDSRYMNGERTPDKTTPRIGTVISVTGELQYAWRPVRGSKVLKIMWLGVPDTQIIDIEERRVKWHERPTLKNGLKAR